MMPRQTSIFDNKSNLCRYFKKNFSITVTTTPSTNANNCLPQKSQAALLEYDLDSSMASTTPMLVTTATNQITAASLTALSVNATQYGEEMKSLKEEIMSLCNIITSVLTEIRSAIESLNTKCSPPPNSMETNAEYPMAMQPPHHIPTDLHDIIQDLKHEIATIIIKTHEIFHQQVTTMQNAHPKKASVT